MNKHIGSDFDEFMREEGIKEEVDRRRELEVICNYYQTLVSIGASKRVLAAAENVIRKFFLDSKP